MEKKHLKERGRKKQFSFVCVVYSWVYFLSQRVSLQHSSLLSIETAGTISGQFNDP